MSVSALIVAAGKGRRLGGAVPKQFRPIAGKPVLRWAAEAFTAHPAVRTLHIVIGEGQRDLAEHALAGLEIGSLIIGGEQRAESVRAGLDQVDAEVVLVHDAARPYCPPEIIDRLLASLEFYSGAVPVLACSDTLARSNGELGKSVDRSGLVRVQTPQAFRTDVLRASYATWAGPSPTDEATVVRAAGHKVAAVPGDPSLDKITTTVDLERAEQWLAGRLVPRTGMGFDVHAFGGEGPIILGGIAIPHELGLAGHSDADVVLHAITDALLGAAGLGDIGQHFPPSDPQWKGAASDIFLDRAAGLIRARGGIIDHADCTIIAETPKIGPYRDAMRSRIAAILGLREDQVSIKATTTEGLGFAGRREGVAAQAVASIRLGSK